MSAVDSRRLNAWIFSERKSKYSLNYTHSFSRFTRNELYIFFSYWWIMQHERLKNEDLFLLVMQGFLNGILIARKFVQKCSPSLKKCVFIKDESVYQLTIEHVTIDLYARIILMNFLPRNIYSISSVPD